MTKKIKKLEKETTQWRTKWESNNQALLQMAEEVTVLFVFGCFDVVAQKNQWVVNEVTMRRTEQESASEVSFS